MKRVIFGMTLAAVASMHGPAFAQDPALRRELESSVREYLCGDAGDAASLAQVVSRARGHDDLLAEIVKTKSYLPRAGPVALRGTIDDRFAFVVDPSRSTESRGNHGGGVGGGLATNHALLHGPASAEHLFPLAIYVPDATTTSGFVPELARDGAGRGWFVFLVPDEKQDNRWDPTPREHRRHSGPLRELLLRHPIDPDRVFMVGSGRGGHATWDIGLTSADRFAAIYPCNGGLITEGGYKASGGVFLENASSLAVFMVFNTTFDHGIESCRYAAKKLGEWGFRCECKEEQRMRVMGLVEATTRLAAITRDAHPRTIKKRFNHLEDGEHYWLRALDRTPREWDPAAALKSKVPLPAEREQRNEAVWALVRKECALLQGAVAGNRVTVTAHGVGRVRVYFDPELVDYRAKVTVSINGDLRASQPLSKQAAVMLQHVRETGDTARLYWACADFPVAR